MGILGLPVELIVEIVKQVDKPSFYALTQTCTSLKEILHDSRVRAHWIMFQHQNNHDALLYAFNKGLVDEAKLIVISSDHPIRDLAEPFAQIICHETSHDLALQTRKLEVIRFILETSEDRSYLDQEFPDKFSLSLQDFAVMSLRWCSYFGEHLLVKYLLSEFGLKISTINCYLTWWIRMLRSGNFELISVLLEHGAEILGTLPDNTDEPPLLSRLPSSRRSSVEEIQQSPNLYPLRIMAIEGRSDAVKLLLQKTPEFQKSPHELKLGLYCALFGASMENRENILQLIVDELQYSLANVDEQMDCLLMAAARGNERFLEEYLSRMTLTPSTQQLHECLIRAVENNRTEMISILKHHGTIISWNDDEALIVACKHGNINSVARLIEEGADISAQDYKAVKLAAKCGSFSIVNMLLSHHEKGVGSRSIKWKIMAKCNEMWKIPREPIE